MLENIMDNYPEEDFLIADGLNDAIIGVDEKSMRLIYSVSSVIDILMQQGMSDTDSLEYFYFNIDGAYMGEKTPIWCHDIY